ncbi:unnamed protein product [Urochloa humidicola]
MPPPPAPPAAPPVVAAPGGDAAHTTAVSWRAPDLPNHLQEMKMVNGCSPSGASLKHCSAFRKMHCSIGQLCL